MKRTLFFIVVFSLLFFQHNSLALSKNNDKAIHIKANNIIYNKSLNAYFASGNCIIYNGEYTIKSDSISFYRNTSLAELKGNILIKDNKGNWIRGTKGTINLTTFKGFINNAIMFVKKNGMYIKASKIIMRSKEKYYAKNGTITGCKCKDCLSNKKGAYPKWSIWAKHTYIVKDKYILAYPIIFRVKSTPILFSPVLSKDLSNKRKTGFLFPAVGYSNKDGIKYEQPFFININPSQDVTLTPFVYTRSGYGLSSKYRFYWTKYSKGEWDLTLFKEKRPYGTSQTKKFRIYAKANQNVNLQNYGTFNYDLNIVNNKDNLRVLNKDNINLNSNRYTTSTASYSISKGAYYLNINGYFYQDLVADNNNATLQKLPEIKFGIINKKLWNNLTLDFHETATNNFRITGERGYSSATSIFLSYPFKLSYFSIVPKIGANELYAYWNDAPDKQHFSKRAFIPEYSLSAKTSLYKVYSINRNYGVTGIKHTITPYIVYKYIPQRDQSEFPDFISTYTKTNNITLSLENKLTIKSFNHNGTTSYREFLYSKISQEYDFAKTNHSAFPPIYEDTEIYPLKNLSFTSKAHFSTRKGMFIDSDEELSINTPTKGISLGYVMSRNSDYTINSENAKVKIYIYPFKKLYTYLYIEKSLRNNYFPQKKIGFMYNGSCWGAGLDFYANNISEENSDGTYSRQKNIGLWITLVLKSLGEIKKQY